MRYLTGLERKKSFSGFLSNGPSSNTNHQTLYIAPGNFYHREHSFMSPWCQPPLAPQAVSAALALEAGQGEIALSLPLS